MRVKTLVTGAGGYLGRLIAQQILQTSDDQVIGWLHADDPQQAEAKIARLQPEFAAYGDRVAWRWGALEGPAPFDGVDPSDIGTIIHGAAVYRFNVDEREARAVNVEGTAKLLDFAQGCANLANVSLVSSLYASGLTAGLLAEERLPPLESTRYANPYEWSKRQAEEVVLARSDLPWQIFRVGMVIADDESGRVTQYNAFHNTLKLFFNGLLSIVPGLPQTPLYFVTGSFAARAIAEISRSDGRHVIHHVCHDRPHNLTLGQLVDIAFDVFGQDPVFKSRRLPKPLYTDAEAFDLLVEGVSGFGGAVMTQALASVAPFARQLFVSKDVANSNLKSALACYDPDDMHALVARTCQDLVRTRFGKIPGQAPDPCPT